jgi:hypothetical protein
MKVCPNCGRENPDLFRACDCGHDLTGVAVTRPPVAVGPRIRVFNRVGLYFIGSGIILLLLGGLNAANDWGKPEKKRGVPAAVSWGALICGLISSAYGITILSTLCPPCPNCTSPRQRRCAVQTPPTKAMFRIGLECADCRTRWLTACPAWVPFVCLSAGALLLIALAGMLVVKSNGKMSSSDQVTGIAILVVTALSSLAVGLRTLTREAREEIIVQRGSL